MHRSLARGLRIFFDTLSAQNVDWHMQYLEKTQWMKKKELQHLQLIRLKKLLLYAYEKVPFYHRIFRKHLFHPADLRTLADLNKLPILRKSDIRANLVQLVSTDYAKIRSKAFNTSGTSATPLRFYRSMTALSWARGAEFRGYGWAGYRLGDKIALIWGFGPEQTRSFTFRFYHSFTRQPILNVNSMSEKSMSKFAFSLVKFKPDFVRGYAGATNVFANYLQRNRQFKIQPKAAFTSAGTLFQRHRKTIEEAFNCEVYDIYGSREISGIAAQCGQHEGLHVSDENVLLEIVKDEETASAGEEGKIYLTSLQNFAMPFIRYDIGDVGKAFSDECACGRKLSLMKPFGRTYEYFVNRDGTFTSLRDIQQVFENIPIIDFQIEQKDWDEIIVRIVPGTNYTQKHTDFITGNIKMRGKARIRVEFVETVPKEKSGKTKRVIKRLPNSEPG